jgi:hypothetical protein
MMLLRSILGPSLEGSTSYDQKVEARIEFGSVRDAGPNQ